MDNLNYKTSKIKSKVKNYYDVFPKNRDFYFLDSYEKIKDFTPTNFEDPEYICVICENKENQIKENLYKRKDFLSDFDFIYVIDKSSNNFIINKYEILEEAQLDY